MRILDRYILKSVLGVFFACLFTFIFLYITIDILSHLDVILKTQAKLNILTQYYLAYIPIILLQLTPFCCLLSVLYTFARFNRDNELVAMRASGLSIFQISKTVIIFGVIASILLFWINDRFVSNSIMFTQKIKREMGTETQKTKEEQGVIKNISVYGTKNRLFFINKFSLATNTLEGIIILEHDTNQNITKKIIADKGVYKDGVWRFYRSITYDFNHNGGVVGGPQYFEEEVMVISETPQEFLSQRQQPDFMNIAQLSSYIWKLSKSGASSVVRNLKVDLYRRFSEPWACLIMVFLAIPFSLKIKKRSTGLSSLGISAMAGFLYYTLNAICLALGKAGILTPLLATSLSHSLVLILSLHLISKLP